MPLFTAVSITYRIEHPLLVQFSGGLSLVQMPDFDAEHIDNQRSMSTDIDQQFIYVWQDLPSQKSVENLAASLSPQTSPNQSPSSKIWYYITLGLLILTSGTFALQSREAIAEALSIHANNIVTEIGMPTRWKW